MSMVEIVIDPIHAPRTDNRREDELMTTRKKEAADQRKLELRASDILDPNNQIGVRLRSLYAAAQDEAIPDRFLDLLEKLDHAEMMASAKMAE
ncbi:hypothetical protein GGE50_000137 [Rhizobium leguminosarum]|jgi:hypothetical protein|uniref:Anti-sigma factor NepR domain-containing protein n=11 Tax=Rhizobium TaxID=379 RepID=A0A7W6UPD2_9HYPH|nr:hypothetical protein [Rhizobium leguminosarum]MBB4441810.1 hypothetical protein [Rhizobium esperanzae]MDH6657718.1 hypothetical protein [Rhizobium sophorae]MBA9035249.1 hypothetical protein [Rhizobium leguminosarum]MBB4331313.1 hypothetical protein [Rhizobium leguminosarum]